MPSATLSRYALLAVVAAVATLALKLLAWRVTGSVGLLSDALESLVNVAAALMALAMLSLAVLPADEDHPYGHGKAEYFSSAFEGLLILLAAGSIGYAAATRLAHPRALDAIGVGLGISVAASLINVVAARLLLSVGRRHNSIALEAGARHLLADVWTSAGVIAGIALVWATGWLWLDPAVALLVAAHIVWMGWQLLHASVAGLMDASLPRAQRDAIQAALERYQVYGLDFHALRTRRSGMRTFVSLHLMVPGHWTVQEGHDWSERIEADLRSILGQVHVTTHVEPREDPLSLADEELDRGER